MKCKTCKNKADSKLEQIKICKKCYLSERLNEELKLKGQCFAIDSENFIQGWNARGKYD